MGMISAWWTRRSTRETTQTALGKTLPQDRFALLREGGAGGDRARPSGIGIPGDRLKPARSVPKASARVVEAALVCRHDLTGHAILPGFRQFATRASPLIRRPVLHCGTAEKCTRRSRSASPTSSNSLPMTVRAWRADRTRRITCKKRHNELAHSWPKLWPACGHCLHDGAASRAIGRHSAGPHRPANGIHYCTCGMSGGGRQWTRALTPLASAYRPSCLGLAVASAGVPIAVAVQRQCHGNTISAIRTTEARSRPNAGYRRRAPAPRPAQSLGNTAAPDVLATCWAVPRRSLGAPHTRRPGLLPVPRFRDLPGALRLVLPRQYRRHSPQHQADLHPSAAIGHFFDALRACAARKNATS